jgi:acetyl/propionyl-CoA carboxylase alpha subunit
LPWTQDSVAVRGHAIECRIYAEDPENGFLPQAGRLLVYREPSGPGLRIDSGVLEGDIVGVNYDPLLAKLIASAETRDAAIARAATALRAYPVLGIHSNVPFLLRLLELEAFRAGQVHTGFIEEHLEFLTGQDEMTLFALAAAAATTAPDDRLPARRCAGPPDASDPWSSSSRWGR